MTLQDDINNIYKLDAERTQGEILVKPARITRKLLTVIGAGNDIAPEVSIELPSKLGDYFAASPLMVSVIRRLEAVIENIARENVLAIRPNDAPAFESCIKSEIKMLMEGK